MLYFNSPALQMLFDNVARLNSPVGETRQQKETRKKKEREE